MNSKKITRFYFEHDAEDKCSVFCIMCNKIAYSTKHNKYLRDQKCSGHQNLQCLNSSCANGFSKTYYNNYIYNNRPKLPPQRSSSSRDYMQMYQLQN